MQLFVVSGGEDLLFEPRHKIVRHLIELGRFFTLAGDDERGSGFIDQNGVDLVDDGKRMAALDHFFFVDGHVVAEIVEAELIVRAVGDVGSVGRSSLGGGQVMDDQADGETEEAVDLAHPLRVALGKIIVDGDDVNAFSGEGV